MEADRAAEAFADAWEILLTSSPGWWGQRRHGLVGGITTVPLPSFNGVWAYARDPDAGTLDALLDEVAEAGLPYCLQARPGAQAAADVAKRRGMVPEEAVPLMVLDCTALPDVAPPGLRIRELPAAEQDVHATLAAGGFEIDAKHFRQLMTPELAGRREWRAYLGEVEGERVSTGGGFTRGEWVGIFNIATPRTHRHRGYGAAVTMRAVRDGVAAGARWAWLQASPDGRPVYERLGFRTLESWCCWIAADARSA